jgi:hypothetical protein
MSLDNLSGMPDWDDQFFEDDNEGEEWKPRPTRDAAKAMYEQWKQVMILLKGAVGDMGLKKQTKMMMQLKVSWMQIIGMT